MHTHPPVPYAAIKRHGVIGDRRTAALVAADGTIDWLSLPDYDSDIVFGALLDAEKGGFWHMGPRGRRLGTQNYAGETTSLVTAWDIRDARLELTDVMAWPDGERPPGKEGQRAILRRLRCVKGEAPCRLQIAPACNFEPVKTTLSSPHTISFRAGSIDIELWVSCPIEAGPDGTGAAFELREGEEVWSVLDLGHRASDWNEKRAGEAMAESDRYWQCWTNKLSYDGPRIALVRRSAILVHQLSYAPTGSHVAAPPTSLPERIGGDANYDYRLCWVRDTSLSLTVLAALGDTKSARRYMEWLSKLVSASDPPLQVVYGIRGETNLTQSEHKNVYGYRGSKPVLLGNRAYKQDQHGSLGYLIDGINIYQEKGGDWRPEFWELVRRIADYIAAHWQDKSNGIWELADAQHYLSGKVLDWVTLDRAVEIAGRLGHAEGVDRWRTAKDKLHAEVMERGWCERRGAFRQRYEGDNLDGSVLLVSVLGFLPPDHPRVISTIERVVEELTIDGFVYRFNPLETPGLPAMPLGEYEAAFLPCTFWLATAYAKAGRTEEAETILRRAESLAGPLGLFAEELDPRSGALMGNSPLLFSQIEYVRAVRTLAGSDD